MLARFLVLCVVVACGAHQPGSELVSELTTIKTEMCACRDHACSERVKADYDALEQRGAKQYGSLDEIPPDVRARLTTLDGEMRACMRALAPPN
jgi:hypothetical protein